MTQGTHDNLDDLRHIEGFPIGADEDILALQAKQRELLERRRADLAALDRRLTLVPDLALVGVALVDQNRGLQ